MRCDAHRNDTCRNNGKPYNVCLAEDVSESISVLRYKNLIVIGNALVLKLKYRYYAGWADKIYGRTIDVGPTKLAYTLHQPIGVCGQIIPWVLVSAGEVRAV